MPVEGLDGGVGVENPGGVEQRRDAVSQVRVQPRRAFRFRDALQGIAQGIFGDHFPHPQQAGIDSVAADRRHVGIAPVLSLIHI